MKEEIHCACEFLSRMLETRNLPVQFINLFKKRLEELLFTRFENHWDTDNPSKGSAYRCIRINGRLDPVIREAAKVTGLSDISVYLPPELTMWIDPKEVSYRFGEEGSICNCSLESMMRENVSTPPEWHRHLSTSSLLFTPASSYQSTVPLSRYSGSGHSNNGLAASRSRTSPVPRRSGGKYSPTPSSKRSQSPPLYFESNGVGNNHHHHHHHHSQQASTHSHSTTGYPSTFSSYQHRFEYVIPVHV